MKQINFNRFFGRMRIRIVSASLPVKAGVILLVLLFLFLLGRGISPLKKMKAIESMVLADTLLTERFGPISNHPGAAPLLAEKSYKRALLDLSEEDSIQLVISLHDSIAWLTVNGVKIHVVPLDYMKIDPLLKNLSNDQYVKLFSAPLKIKSQYATIVKEPIVVRHAPKDTAEAAANAWQPDTLIQNPAFLQMKLDHGIQVIIEQSSNPSIHDRLVRMKFKSRTAIGNLFRDLGNFFSFRKQDYRPLIVIKMPVGDLRAVYRALPVNPKLVLYFDTKNQNPAALARAKQRNSN